MIRITPEGPLVTASVWHRPVVSDDAKDELARRQAALISLLRLGHAEQVLPYLAHSPDPRLRSFIVNWLNPLGAIPACWPTSSTTCPDRRSHPGPRSAEDGRDPLPSGDLDVPGVVLAGTYGKEAFPPGEQEILISKLLGLYRQDPDSGIHGVAEWTLWKWGQQDNSRDRRRVEEGQGPGDRRWFVNGQGQAFAVIDGPVETMQGSPPTEPERDHATEHISGVVIPAGSPSPPRR